MWMLSAIELAVRLAFPGVPSLTPAALQARIDEGSRRVVLVDVRTPTEFGVSHLPDALSFNADSASAADWDRLFAQVNNVGAPTSDAVPPTTVAPVVVPPVVVAYCSVGYRSAAFVQQWQQRYGKSPASGSRSTPDGSASIPQALNLQGSIFRWAAEGRPLVNAAGSTDLVHGFARPWAWLVPSAKRVID